MSSLQLVSSPEARGSSTTLLSIQGIGIGYNCWEWFTIGPFGISDNLDVETRRKCFSFVISRHISEHF